MGLISRWGAASRRGRLAVVGGATVVVAAAVGAAGAVVPRAPVDAEFAGVAGAARAELDIRPPATAPSTTTTTVAAAPLPPTEAVLPAEPVASDGGAPDARSGPAGTSAASRCADGICSDLIGPFPTIPQSELARRIAETGSPLLPGEYPVATGPPVSVEIAPTTVPPPPEIVPTPPPVEPVP
jgi:hypothetical protein